MRRGHKGRVDKNHGIVVEALEKAGAQVQSLASVGEGCPDLMAWYRGRVVLLEVKGPKGKLTADQAAFIKKGWPVWVVTTPDEAIAALQVMLG